VDMLDQGDWVAVADFRTYEYPIESVIAKKTWLDKNGEIARNFMKALVEAEERLQHDHELAYQMTKTMFPKMDDALVRKISEVTLQRLCRDGSTSAKGVQTSIKQQIFAGTIPQAVPHEAFVDLSCLPEK